MAIMLLHCYACCSWFIKYSNWIGFVPIDTFCLFWKQRLYFLLAFLKLFLPSSLNFGRAVWERLGPLHSCWDAAVGRVGGHQKCMSPDRRGWGSQGRSEMCWVYEVGWQQGEASACHSHFQPPLQQTQRARAQPTWGAGGESVVLLKKHTQERVNNTRGG